MAALWLMLASASHAKHLAYMETAYTHACAGQLRIVAVCAELFPFALLTGVPACPMMVEFLLTAALSCVAGAGAAASSNSSDRARRGRAAAGVDHLPRAGRHCTHLPALRAAFLKAHVSHSCICQPALHSPQQILTRACVLT
jgi:hypothetical protein